MPFLFNRVGVVIGMMHWLLPFMIFSILVSLVAQGSDLHLAARVMGAGPLLVFRRVVLPLLYPRRWPGRCLRS